MKTKQKDFVIFLKTKCPKGTLAELLSALKFKDYKDNLGKPTKNYDWGLAVVANCFGKKYIGIGASIPRDKVIFGTTIKDDRLVWFKWNLTKDLYRQKPLLQRNAARLLGFKPNSK